MKQIAAATFKKQCLALIDDVDPDGIVITKDGKPVAKLIPLGRDSAIVGRDIGALAEVGDDLHVPRQLIGRIPRLALRGGGERESGEERRNCERAGAG